jgi:ligand-binding sensor domain-containing protein
MILFMCASAALSEPALALDPGKAITQFTQDTWDAARGLPSNQVNAILQTRDGYLWIATSGGLARFNGMTFTVFTKENTTGLPANDVWSLLEDRKGVLWVGTNEGLVRYKGGRFCDLMFPEKAMLSLAEDTEGAIWTGNWNELRRVKDGQFAVLDREAGLTERVAARQEGGVWAKGREGGFKHVQAGRVEAVAQAGAIMITSLLEDREGNLWLGATGAVPGLYRLRQGQLRRYVGKDKLPHEIINVIYQDRAGSLWIGTQGGLSRLAAGRFSSYTFKDGLPDNAVRALCEDQEGGLWIGMTSGGLVRLREGSFTTYTVKEGLGLNDLRSVCASSDGAVWAGTNGNGVSRFKDGVFTTFNNANGFPMGVVNAIAEDSTGGMWFGSFRERQSVYFKSGRFVRYQGQAARSFLVDGDTVWLGMDGDGLHRFQDGRFDALKATGPQIGGVIGTFVWTIHKDPEARVWVGLHGNLCALREGDFICHAVPKTQHVAPPVLSIQDDPEGGLWLGTWVGLFHFKDGVFQRYGVEVGLPETRIMTVLEDGQRDLWLCTPNALLRIRRAALDQWEAGQVTKLTYETYDTTHGMKSAQFDFDGIVACRARDGRLWFATMGGLVSVDPAAITKSDWAPPVMIEDVLVDKRRVSRDELDRLAPGRGDIEVRYAGLSYHVPERMLFRYKLEGFDTDWVDAGSRRAAFYTNVPPGKYAFKVKACNSDGAWNEQGASLDIRLLPHFYQTKWFAALLGAVLVGGAMGLYRLRVRHHLRLARTLHARIEEAVAHIKTLRGLLPMCAWCRKVRDDSGYWSRLEEYVSEHTDAEFSHGICPECREKRFRRAASESLSDVPKQ